MLSKLRLGWTAMRSLFGYLVADPLHKAAEHSWAAACRIFVWALLLTTAPGLLAFWMVGIAPLDYISDGRLTDTINRSEAYRYSYSCMETRVPPKTSGAMPIATPFTARFRHTSSQGFKDGHLCSKYTPVSKPSSSCLSSAGQVIERTPAAAAPECSEWKLEAEECCTEVTVGSNVGALAGVRALLLGNSRGGWSFRLVAPIALLALAGVGVAGPFIFIWFVQAWVRGAASGYSVVRSASRAPHLETWRPQPVSWPVALQMTDLHLTGPGAAPYELRTVKGAWEGALPSGDELVRRVRVALQQAKSLEGDVLLALTGDITDEGLESQWEIATEAVGSFVRDESMRTAVIPGNHDLSFNPSERSDIFFTYRDARIASFRQFSASLGAFTDEAGQRAAHTTEWPKAMQVTVGARTFLVLGFDSTTPSKFVLSNAVGRLGSRQISQARSLLSDMDGPLLVLIHHHPAWHIGDESSIVALASIAVDGNELLALLAQYQAREVSNKVLVAHGHQHRAQFGMYHDANGQRVRIFGCPSSTLGAEVKGADGLRLDRQVYVGILGFDVAGEWSAQVRAIL